MSLSLYLSLSLSLSRSLAHQQCKYTLMLKNGSEYLFYYYFQNLEDDRYDDGKPDSTRPGPDNRVTLDEELHAGQGKMVC